MTYTLGGDLCVKPVVSTDGANDEPMWLFFRQGELQNPLLVVQSYQMTALLDAIEKERDDRRRDAHD